MAVSYKNIVITPNIGNTADPKIVFSGANSTVNTDISMFVYPAANGTVSFEGTAGQLFSITNDLSNSLFSVSDISGIPSLEIFANSFISIAPLSGNVGIGNTTPAHKLSVNGSIYLTPGDTNRIWSGSDNLRLGEYPQLQVSDTLQIVGGQQSIVFGGTGAYATIGSNVPWDFVKTTTAQAIRIYGTYTDASNYERLLVSSNSTASYVQSQAIGTGTARPLFLGANNATVAVVAANGNMGVGTTTPTTKFQVIGTSTLGSSSRNITILDNNTGQVELSFNGSDSNASRILTNQNDLIIGPSTGIIRISNTTSGPSAPMYMGAVSSSYAAGWGIISKGNYPLVFESRATDVNTDVFVFDQTVSGGRNLFNVIANTISRFIISSSGNVGIGNTTPSEKLVVQGNVYIGSAGTDSNRLIFNNSTGSDSIRIRTVGSSTGWVLTSNGVDTIYFNNGSLQVPTVQATTSVISPIFTNDGGAGGRVFTANSASLSGMHLKANNTSWYLDNRGSNGNNVFGISNGGALAFAIQQSGEVGIGTTTPTAKLAIVNGTSPTTQHIYGTYTDGSNYERLAITANSTAAYIQTEKAGTGTAKNIILGAGSTPIVTLNASGYAQFDQTKVYGANWGAGYHTNALTAIVFELSSSVDNVLVKLTADDTNIMAQRSGTANQTSRIYGTYTDASNYERLNISANSTAAYITAEEAGTGTARPLYLGANNATVMTVAANGNVGIGNTSPTDILDVTGVYRFKTGATPLTIVRNSDNASIFSIAAFGTISGSYTGFTHDAQGLSFLSNASDGHANNIYYNFSGPVYSNPTSGTTYGAKFKTTFQPSSGTANVVGVFLDQTINQTSTANGNYTTFLINTTETSVLGTNNNLVDIRVNNVTKFAISSNGNVSVGNSTVNTVISSTTTSLINLSLMAAYGV
jgi:hypothetical protein